jgi:phage/plasmid-associated DNA primase
MAETKMFLEGDGLMVNCKNEHPVRYFAEAAIVISCNDIPEIKSVRDRAAIDSRLVKVKFTRSFDRNRDKFPFGTPELARWLLETYKSSSFTDEAYEGNLKLAKVTQTQWE